MAKNDLSERLRRAGQDARKQILAKTSVGGTRGGSDGIFSILDYIESDWGLGMTLFPAQRAIVKLYYHLELDDTLPENPSRQIKIVDVRTGEVRYVLTEKQWLKYIYEQGRCNIGEQDHERRQLLLSIGRRGGKCVDGDTLVATDKGFFRIAELGDPEGPEWQPLEIGVAQEGRTKSKSSHFYNNGVADTISVKSSGGYGVSGTENHRVRVMTESGVVDWRPLGEVRVGDYLAIHRQAGMWPTSYVDLSGIALGKEYKGVTLPDEFDERWGFFLGCLMGTFTKSGRRGLKRDYSAAWCHLAAKHKGLFRGPGLSGKVWMGTLSYKLLGYLKLLGFDPTAAPSTFTLPWVILRSPERVVGNFLRGLFASAGSIQQDGAVHFNLSSDSLSKELQVLLLNYGIVCRRTMLDRETESRHHLTIREVRSRLDYLEKIGFSSRDKAAALRRTLRPSRLLKSYYQGCPHQREPLNRLLQSTPPGAGKRFLQKITRASVKPSTLTPLSYLRIEDLLTVGPEAGASKETLGHFRHLRELDYAYERVAEVQQGRGKVYDLSVPSGESFVANGLTNHNTTMSGIFASYELYRLLNLHDPQDYYGLPSSNVIQILSVAPEKDQAGILFQEVSGHISKCDYFKPYVASNTQSFIKMRSPKAIEDFGTEFRNNGQFASINGKISIRLSFKGATAKGLRGFGNAVFILDEFAFFEEGDGPASAEKVYTAIEPSMAAFSPKDPTEKSTPIGPNEARIICISSPKGKSGKFYDLYQQAFAGGKGSENMLAVQAPTWEINPSVSLPLLQQKLHSNPTSFRAEFGAEFNDQLTGWIEREEDLLACINPDRRPTDMGAPRISYQMGIDIGLVGDGTFIAITHVEDGKIILDYHEGWVAGESWRQTNPHLGRAYSTDYAKTLEDQTKLDFDEIALWIAAISKRFRIRDGIFDAHHGLPLEQSLHKMGLRQFKMEQFTQSVSSQIYQATKLMMYDESLELYDWPLVALEAVTEDNEGSPRAVIPSKHSPYIAELLTLQAKQLSKSVIRVEAPQKRGAHDDFSDALVRSIWLSIRHMSSEKYTSGRNASTAPRAAVGASLRSVQNMKARRHGGFTGRSAPRGMRR